MFKKKKYNKIQYNLDKLDSIITVAIIGEKDTIYVKKDVAKLAKQMLKIRGMYGKIKIKTY